MLDLWDDPEQRGLGDLDFLFGMGLHGNLEVGDRLLWFLCRGGGGRLDDDFDSGFFSAFDSA